MNEVERNLVSALESGVSSSYRIITGGVHGVDGGNSEKVAATEVKNDEAASSCDDAASAVDPAFALPIGKPHANAAVENVLSTMIPSGSPEILVICGEESEPCAAMEVAATVSLHRPLQQ